MYIFMYICLFATGCRVLSYKSLIPILHEKFGHYPNKKDIYFIGDSLGTQQYLAASCDFEIEMSKLDIKFIVSEAFSCDCYSHSILFTFLL